MIRKKINGNHNLVSDRQSRIKNSGILQELAANAKTIKSTEIPELSHFKNKYDETIYNNLPEIIKRSINLFSEQTEKEVFLFSALPVISGILPNVHGFYDDRFYTPHIYSFLTGKYGKGKGIAKNAKQLAYYIDKEKRDLYNRRIAEYEADETVQVKPPNTRLFIPADSGKSGIVQLLTENNEQGIIFLTEVDTLTESLSKDFGGFSDILRGIFHHEGYCFFRRTGNESRDIEKGYLALLMTGTADQLKKLIPSAENGLFSRFLFYIYNDDSNKFKRVFDPNRHTIPAKLDEISKEFKKIYDTLSELETPIQFSFTTKQKETFYKLMQGWKNDLTALISENLEGTVNRLALITFRIAMQFSILRVFEWHGFEGGTPDEIVCTDEDFETAVRIVAISKNHAVKIFNALPKTNHINFDDSSNEAAKLTANYLYRYDSKKFSYRKIAEILGVSHTIVGKWIKG